MNNPALSKLIDDNVAAWTQRFGVDTEYRDLVPTQIECVKPDDALLGSLDGILFKFDDLQTVRRFFDVKEILKRLDLLAPGGTAVLILSSGWNRDDLLRISQGGGFSLSLTGDRTTAVFIRPIFTKEESIEKKRLSVVIPAVQASNVFADSVHSWESFLGKYYGEQAEIIVVDDCILTQEDKFEMMRKETGGRMRLVSHYRKFGPGRAVRTGILHASGRKILIDESQGSIPSSEIFPLLVSYLRDEKEKRHKKIGVYAGITLQTGRADPYDLRNRRKFKPAFSETIRRFFFSSASPDSRFRLYTMEAARTFAMKTASDGEDFRREALKCLRKNRMACRDIFIDRLQIN